MKAIALQLRAEDGQVIVFVIAILTILIGIGRARHRRRLMVQGPAASTDVRGCRRARRRPGLAVRGNRAVHCDRLRADELHGAARTYRHLSLDRAQLRHEHLYRRCSRDHGAGLSRQDLWVGLQQCDSDTRTREPGIFVPSMLKNVAPIAVKREVACAATSPACYGQTVTFNFDESNVSSSTIGLINLTCHSTASTACGSSAGIGGSQLKDWIENGYVDALPANQWYGVKTGETVGPVKQGLTDRIGTPLFFPVFDTTANSGSSYFFHIIGWAAFVIESVDSWGPGGRQLTGHFVTYIASDLAAGDPASGTTDFGVHVISLIQ